MARRKKKSSEEHQNHERWLVSYADFITLLFAFFTILYATSEQDKKKQEQFQKSLQQHVYSFAGTGGSAKQTVDQATKQNSPVERPLQKFAKGPHASEKVLNRVENYIVDNVPRATMEKYITEMDTEALGVRLTLSSDAIFEGSTEKFKKSSLSVLDTLGSLLKEQRKSVWVEGHMDGESGDKSAWSLSAARATALVRYFLKVHNLDAQSIAAVAFGAERPLFPNDSLENRMKNRRVSFLILTQEAPF
ncbi:MAG: flagellar motor protein MotB [Bdellovibrionales bacterium]|nr:flagellar motor protein MotB [Bdellovibrionales bacterium]